MSMKSGGNNGGKPPDKTYCDAVNGVSSMTSAGALGGGVISEETRMRSFAEILASEQANRNILEIHLNRLSIEENNVTTRAKALTHDDLGELIFDVLNVDYKDCLGFNYSTGKYDTREIKFKPGVDLTPYIKTGLVYKDHEVSTKKQMNNLTKVSFRNVPFNIPDEEIIQLYRCYGTPLNNKVNYEKMHNNRNKGMVGSTRWVEMDLKANMNNFYWLEGPLPGDRGSRVTVLHSGQDQQCSNCLRTGRGGCKAMGNGKACEEMKIPRAKMVEYMAELRKVIGYESLKSLYMKQYPSLKAGVDSIIDDEKQTGDDDEESEVLPSNPIKRRDEKIAELENTVATIPKLKEEIEKAKDELKNVVKSADVTGKRVKFARKVTEEWLKETLPAANFEDHSQVLVSLMSSLYSFEMDPESESLKPKEDFLKDIEESFEDNENKEVLKERLEYVKTSLIMRVNETVKLRRSSIGSIGSLEGRKRHASGDTGEERSALRRNSHNPEV